MARLQRKKKAAETEKTEESKALTNAWHDLGNVIFSCRRDCNYSFRLLSALTGLNYGDLYNHSVDAEPGIGRGARRGPIHKADKAALRTTQHIVDAMSLHKITPRKWCNAYNLPLYALFDVDDFYKKYGHPVKDWLMEDFPEAFGLCPELYKTKPFYYSTIKYYYACMPGKKGLHVFFAPEFKIRVKNVQKGYASYLASTLTWLAINLKRLEILTIYGQNAALNWVPNDPSITKKWK